MRVLGIDPGLAKLGWGIVDKKGSQLFIVDYGCLRTKSEQDIAQRLGQIFDKLMEIREKFQPEVLAIEKLFFQRNVSSALTVGQVCGVAILAAQRTGLTVFEYTPLQIKQALVGYGRAEKQQVQNMVKVLLNLKEIPQPFDAADALGAAICHLQQAKFNFAKQKAGINLA